VSLRISVAAKLRIIHSVIQPVLEYDMEVWGPPAHLVAGTLQRSGSNRPTPLVHFDQLLLSACRLACGVRALPGEPGWTRRACVSPEVLLSVCQVLPSERACDLAHLRYSERLRAASRQPHIPNLPFTSVLPPVLLWHLTIPGCGACCAPLSSFLILFHLPPLLSAACTIICARRLLLPGGLPWPRTLRKTSLPGGVGVDLARQPTSTLSGAPLTCPPHRCSSCTLALLWCSLSSVSSQANSLSVTLWTGTLFPCTVCVRGQTVRCPSPCPRLEQLGATH
jgi:hypothetical protein